MQTINLPLKSNKTILALGPESAGNFSIYHQGQIHLSPDFGDLLDIKKLAKFQKSVTNYLAKNKLKPTVILSDLHPLYHTTSYAQKLAKKYKTKHLKVQHHYAHICSALGEYLSDGHKVPKQFMSIACDGTGYGLDQTIWGGEVFRFKIKDLGFKIERIGSLESQTLIGGDLAVHEPARVLLAILHKAGLPKEKIWSYLKKHYNKNQFELLYNQLLQNFNCQETTSTARVLDAVSLLLGFCSNKRNYKHEPALLLEKNSTVAYGLSSYVTNNKLSTTHLFKYLIKNLSKDKEKLAATAQSYIAKGLYTMITNYKLPTTDYQLYFSGGLAANKIMQKYLVSKGAIVNKKIPCGDASLSFGQITFYLISNKKTV